MVLADKAARRNAKLQLQYTKIIAPVSGPDGRAARPPGQPRPQRRHDAAGRDQPDRARSRELRGAGQSARARSAPVRARAPLEADARACRAPAPPSTGTVTFIDNTVDHDDGHDQAEGDVPEHAITGCGRAPSSRSRCSWRSMPHAIVVPAPPCRTASRASTCSSSARTARSSMRPVDGGSDRAATTRSWRRGLEAGEKSSPTASCGWSPGARISIEAPAPARAG